MFKQSIFLLIVRNSNIFFFLNDGHDFGNFVGKNVSHETEFDTHTRAIFVKT